MKINKKLVILLSFMLFSVLFLGNRQTLLASDLDFSIDNSKTLTSYKGNGGDVVIPKDVIAIGEKAFAGCKSIKSVVIPSGVKIIREAAFDSCDQLEKVVIPSTVKTIEQNAFYGCTNLKAIELPNQIETIGFGAFCSCDSLNGIIIPDSVKEIGNYSFGFLCVNGKYFPAIDYVIIGKEKSVAQNYAEKYQITFLTSGDFTAKLNKVTNSKKGKVNVTWIRNSNTSGYQIQYATNKKFSKAKTVTASADNGSKTISSLKKGSTYYFRVRGYRTVAGKKYYSAWSTSKSVKIKK